MTATKGALAGDALTRALINAAAQGLHTHCGDLESRHYWLSEDAAERAEAARLCIGCPVINECGTAATARRERFGVWAAKDRTVRPGHKGLP